MRRLRMFLIGGCLFHLAFLASKVVVIGFLLKLHIVKKLHQKHF